MSSSPEQFALDDRVNAANKKRKTVHIYIGLDAAVHCWSSVLKLESPSHSLFILMLIACSRCVDCVTTRVVGVLIDDFVRRKSAIDDEHAGAAGAVEWMKQLVVLCCTNVESLRIAAEGSV